MLGNIEDNPTGVKQYTQACENNVPLQFFLKVLD